MDKVCGQLCGKTMIYVDKSGHIIWTFLLFKIKTKIKWK